MKHVIIGNGPAGVVAAETLRKADRTCSITLVGDEPEPPYSRMALPYFMMGDIGEAGTYLRKGEGHFGTQRIDLVQGRAASIDPNARGVRLEDGTVLAYDRVLVATGAHAIKPPIPGVDLPGVHACWTMEDARRIIARAKTGSRVLQIGAGFIGCIIMEALVNRGVQLTIVEMGDRMVPRMMTPVAGNLIRAWCERKGITVHTSARVVAIANSAAADDALVAMLDSGQTLEADLVIVAAGVRPNIAFLAGSGVACATGVLVDASMQSSVGGIYAAGDVAEGIDASTGKRAVNAIQPTAVEQARLAALNMAGRGISTRGNLVLNVLDTLGLVATSFGQWAGVPGGEHVDGDERRLGLECIEQQQRRQDGERDLGAQD